MGRVVYVGLKRVEEVIREVEAAILISGDDRATARLAIIVTEEAESPCELEHNNARGNKATM